MKNNLFTKSDLKYTLRLLAKKPGFALLSVLVLAGGIAVSVVAFTFSYTMFFKPIPVPNGDSIYHICTGTKFSGCRPFKAFEFSKLRQDITTLEKVGIFSEGRETVGYKGTLISALATKTEWNMFQLTQTRALLGRTLQEYDQQANAEPVLVLAYAFWQRHFDESDEIVGTVVSIRDVPTRVVGVMPEGYLFPWAAEIWMPISPSVLEPLENEFVQISTFGQLKPGVLEETASAEIAGLMGRLRKLYPSDISGEPSNREEDISQLNTGHIATFPMGEFGGATAAVILILVGLLGGSVFLLACINVGTLFLARTNERMRDISIRVALGAPRKRLLFQSMGESVFIAVTGSVLAVLVAGAAMEVLEVLFSSISTSLMAFWQKFQVDTSTLVGAVLFMFVTILLTSALPTIRIINGDFNAVMRDGTRGALGLQAGRVSRSLVVIAVTIVTLLVCVGSLAGSYGASIRQGIQSMVTSAGDVVSARPVLDPARYSPIQRQQFYHTLKDNLLREPTISDVQFRTLLGVSGIEREGVATAMGGRDFARAARLSIAGYPATTVPGLAEGRNLNEFDRADSTPVALVSRSLAERLWPDRSAIGQRLRDAYAEGGKVVPWRQVVGVVNDFIITEDQLFSGNRDTVYFPMSQLGWQNAVITVNTNGDALKAASVLRRSILALDSSIPDFQVYSPARGLGPFVTAFNLGLGLVAGCALFSFLVAIAGIFGLTQNSVLLATQEIGTRRALGATDRRIGRTFLVRGSKQVFIGFVIAMLLVSPIIYLVVLMIGGIGILVETMLLSTLAIVVCLYGTVLLAIHYPVRKILQLEPSDALKHE